MDAVKTYSQRTGLAAVGGIKARLLGSELIQSPIEKLMLIADCQATN
jgi:hypothetical protein